MAHRVKRLRFSKFGPKRKALPRGLEFLKGFRFYAIAQHQINGRVQRRIEFLPKGLKSFIEKVSRIKELKNEKRKAKNKALQSELSEMKLRYKNLEDQFEAIVKRQQEGMHKISPGIKSPKSALNKIEENQIELNPYTEVQGGSTGL